MLPSSGLPGDALALVVDHDRDTRALFSEWLHVWGYRTADAATTAAALELALTLSPAIIITGLGFPDDQDGCWFCQQLKADENTKHVPVLVVTAWVMGGHIERARRAGADSVLTKPCAPSALHAEVRRLAGLSRSSLAM